MSVLVLNCGSSSIRFQLHDAAAHRALARGLVSRIGEEGAQVELQGDDSSEVQRAPVPDHGRGLELILDAILDPSTEGAYDASWVAAVGHRVVHGGTFFTAPVMLDAGAMAKIEECAPLAPLHNPPALDGIRAALRILPTTPQVAVFDTAFHATIPARAHVYALPHEYYGEHRVRRYGFHGISYQAVSQRLDVMLDGGLRELRVVIAHLGNGASIAAVDRGRCADTSMGMTPL